MDLRCCWLVLAASVLLCNGTIITYKPQTSDVWQYDNNNILEPGLVVQWSSTLASTQLATITLYDQVSFGTDPVLATLTSGSGTSNAYEPGLKYSEYLVPSGLKLSNLAGITKPYVYIYVPCTGFLCSSDEAYIFIKLTPTDPCRTTTCTGHSTCRVDAGVAKCYCDTGYYNPKDDNQDECVNCATRAPCPLKSTCNPTNAACACDPGYAPSVGGGCELSSVPSPQPTPSAFQPTPQSVLAPSGFCPSSTYCSVFCRSSSSINGFGMCCADCSTATSVSTFNGACSNGCPAARWAGTPEDVRLPTPPPTSPPTPWPTPRPTPSGGAPSTVADLCGCSNCNCAGTCCATKCGARKPSLRCDTFNGLLVTYECTCGPLVGGGDVLVARVWAPLLLSVLVVALQQK